MADNSFGDRMHPADLEALYERLRDALAPIRSPVVNTGADAAIVRQVMREEIQRSREDRQRPDEQVLRRIVKEEIDRDRDRNREDCRRMIHEEADRIVDEKLTKVFRDLDMSIDPQDINETRKKLGRLFDWQASAHEWRGTFFSTVIKTFAAWIVGIGSAALGYFWVRNGTGH